MKKQILVVDDSESIREVISIALTEAGYEAKTAENGIDALEKLKETERFHLIISDLNMPQMDGISFLKEVRALEAHKYLPLIILTTESQEAKIQIAKAAGATAWMIKPFKKENLVAVIKKLIG